MRAEALPVVLEVGDRPTPLLSAFAVGDAPALCSVPFVFGRPDPRRGKGGPGSDRSAHTIDVLILNLSCQSPEERDTMSRNQPRDQRRSGPVADACRRRRLRLRPSVTALEGRTLLSVFTVTNTDDIASETGTLRWAVTQADSNPGVADTITFSKSVFRTPTTINLSPGDGGQLTLTNPATTTIVGPGANLLSVNGGGTSRVFYLHGGSAALSGLTITGGHDGSGGGVDNNGGTLTLTGVTISHSSASTFGGGLFNTNGGTATLTNCTISGNSANFGGGVNNYVSPQRLALSTMTLTNCTVTGNSATLGYGGGLANIYGTVALTGTTISGNSAHNGAGGLENDRGTMTLTNCHHQRQLRHIRQRRRLWTTSTAR